MPKVDVLFYREGPESVPMKDWLLSLNTKAQEKCVIKMQMLRDMGHELRRPHADYLKDGIYELRVKDHKLNYRILYFFYGTMAVVISHGLAKEARVPPAEIDRAAARKEKFMENPEPHIYLWEIPR